MYPFILQDYDLCQTCHATVDHLRKKLGFNMGDDEKTSQNTIANRAQLFKRRNEFLIHSCQCRDHTCSKPLCIKMKQLLHHARDCKMRASGKCSAHNFFIRMCTSLTKEREEAKCACANMCHIEAKNEAETSARTGQEFPTRSKENTESKSIKTFTT